MAKVYGVINLIIVQVYSKGWQFWGTITGELADMKKSRWIIIITREIKRKK